MSFLKKISSKTETTASDALPALIRALYQKVGNKRYMHDLEDLLKRLEPLSAFENETLWYLIRDLKNQ